LQGLVKKGSWPEVEGLVEELQPGLLQDSPSLRFELKRCQFMQVGYWREISPIQGSSEWVKRLQWYRVSAGVRIIVRCTWESGQHIGAMYQQWRSLMHSSIDAGPHRVAQKPLSAC
jgi:hypothetical protein